MNGADGSETKRKKAKGAAPGSLGQGQSQNPHPSKPRVGHPDSSCAVAPGPSAKRRSGVGPDRSGGIARGVWDKIKVKIPTLPNQGWGTQIRLGPLRLGHPPAGWRGVCFSDRVGIRDGSGDGRNGGASVHRGHRLQKPHLSRRVKRGPPKIFSCLKPEPPATRPTAEMVASITLRQALRR
jgi:hypothetical protein